MSRRGEARLPRRHVALAIGAFGGLIAWIVHLGGSFLLIPWVCSAGPEDLLHLVTLATGLFAVAATGASIWAFLQEHDGGGSLASDDTYDDASAQARKLIAIGGAIVSGYFAFLIVGEGLPALLMDDPCGAIPTLDDPIIMLGGPVVKAGVSPAFAHPDRIVGPGGFWTAWNLDLWITGAIVLATSVYLTGVRHLWARAGRGRGLRPWRVGAYLAGMGSLALALLSPIDALGETLFSVHMIQHMLLMVVAAPLIVLGHPMLAYLWAVSPTQRRSLVRRWKRSRALSGIWTGLAHPAVIFALHVGALWIWHLPELYEGALDSRLTHAAQHATFLFTATLFWWSLAQSGRRGHWPGYGAAILYVLATTLQSGALGALLLFAPTPWYPAHEAGASLWGVDLLVDQQVAGALMWIPAGLVYAAAAVVLFLAWLRKADVTVSRRERRGWASLDAGTP